MEAEAVVDEDEDEIADVAVDANNVDDNDCNSVVMGAIVSFNDNDNDDDDNNESDVKTSN